MFRTFVCLFFSLYLNLHTSDAQTATLKVGDSGRIRMKVRKPVKMKYLFQHDLFCHFNFPDHQTSHSKIMHLEVRNRKLMVLRNISSWIIFPKRSPWGQTFQVDKNLNYENRIKCGGQSCKVKNIYEKNVVLFCFDRMFPKGINVSYL